MLSYFLQVSAFWLGFWSLYVLFFRKENFFQINRIYLLGSLLAGLLLPLISWASFLPTQTLIQTPVIWLETAVVSATGMVANTTTSADATPWLLYAYGVGCSVFIIRLCYGIVQLIQKIKQNHPYKKEGLYWVMMNDIQAPFSWFKFLFWNDNLSITAKEKQAVIAHERAHIEQGHSWDVLLTEIIGVFFWWNPIWYFYKKAIQTNHEFLADAAALKLTPVKNYGHLLIRQSLAAPAMMLVQPFSPSPLKNRIIMMTKNASSKNALWKYLLILPVASLIIFACTKTDLQEEVVPVAKEYQPAFQQIDTVITFDPSDLSEETQIVKTDIYEKVEQMPVFGVCGDKKAEERKECSQHNLLTHIHENVTYPEEARLAEAEGVVLMQFIVSSSGSVGSIVIKKSSGSEALDQAARLVIESLSTFQPGELNGETVNVQMVLPIKFKLK